MREEKWSLDNFSLKAHKLVCRNNYNKRSVTVAQNRFFLTLVNTVWVLLQQLGLDGLSQDHLGPGHLFQDKINRSARLVII